MQYMDARQLSISERRQNCLVHNRNPDSVWNVRQ